MNYLSKKHISLSDKLISELSAEIRQSLELKYKVTHSYGLVKQKAHAFRLGMNAGGNFI